MLWMSKEFFIDMAANSKTLNSNSILRFYKQIKILKNYRGKI